MQNYSLLAQRMAEEQELIEEQKKRRAQVQFEAQSLCKKDGRVDEASEKDGFYYQVQKSQLNLLPVAIKSPRIANYRSLSKTKVYNQSCKRRMELIWMHKLGADAD
ncbi:hypothetical protein Tco_0146255 [Tanacetum coccineum]